MYHDERGELGPATPSPARAPDPMAAFTCMEWVNFLELRRRYRAGQDEWDARELAHLRFLRWLRQMGRLES